MGSGPRTPAGAPISLPVIIRPFAELDLAEARDYYRQESSALEDRFLDQVAQAVGRIMESPNLFPKVLRDVRKAPVHVFPYNLFYVVRRDTIIVVAVYHHSRAPSAWNLRLPRG